MNRVLNKGCHWELIWGGVNVSGMGLDDMGLDSFLLKHINDYKFKGAVFYSRTAQEATDEKLQQAKSDLLGASIEKTRETDESGEPEEVRYMAVQNSIGVTKAIGLKLNNGNPLVTPMSTENYKRKKIQDLTQGKDYILPDGRSFLQTVKGLTSTFEQLVDMEAESWKGLTQYGTDVHKIFEDVFNGQEPTTKGTLPDTVFESVVKQVKNFRKSLEVKYPGCKFYPEFGIMSKNLSQDTKAILAAQGFDSINGVIDLLVVDAKGFAHIYDYKVSRKGIAETADENNEMWGESSNEAVRDKKLWSSAKKLSATYQTEFYKQMLLGYGIRVQDTNILPVKLNLEYSNPNNPFEVTAIKGVEVQSEPKQIIKDPGMRKDAVYYSKIRELFSRKATATPKDAETLATAWAHFFPKSSIITKREQDRANIAFYKQHDRYVHKLRPGEYGYDDKKVMYRLRFPMYGSKPIICEEAKVDENIEDFIRNKSEIQSTKYLAIADALDAAKNEGDITLLLNLVDNERKNFMQNEFGRYISNDWDFQVDEGANSLGIFVFKKGKKSEIVVLSSQPLREQQNLGKGTSLLGKTDSDKNVDSTKILPALVCNMEMMKAMMYISLHPEVFDNSQISEIRAVNPWLGISQGALNSDLFTSFDLLVRKNPGCGLNRLNQKLFMEDRVSLVEAAKERVEGLEPILQSGGMFNPYSEEWFKDKIDSFKKKFGFKMDLRGSYQNTAEWNAYQKLVEGLNLCKGIRAHVETDKSDINATGKVFELNGLILSSPQFSPSANIRELGQVIDKYAKEVRHQVFKIGAPIQMAFQEFYKAHGTGAKSFDILFADKEHLILKDPDSPEFDGDPVAKKTLKIFLETMAKLRHPEYTTEEDLERAKLDEDYYAIPLLEAVASRQIKNVGIFKMFKNKLKQYKTLTEGLFMGEEIKGGMAEYISEHHELYNKFKCNMDMRDSRLEQYGYGMFETDLELVMNAALVAYCRSNVSKNYVESIAGLKMALEAIDSQGSTEHTADMANIRKQFDNVVKSKFFGESIVPEGLQGILRWINVVKHGFTKLTLSLNVRSFLRESLQGIYTGLARAGVKLYPGITRKTYDEALGYVIQEAHKNFSGVSMLQQMNAIYGMANQSLTQLAGQRRVNWAHIRHWGQDTLFLTCTAPDFMHRMSLLIAKMKGDGCFDAHSLDENGRLKYDFKKDGRFQHLINNDTSSPEYLKEKSLYLSMIEEFKKDGFRNEDGSELNGDNLDALPQAYTRQEGQSIKNYADYLYGHYDEESKSLLYDSFLGSIFLQYKTYLTSRLEQWTMHEGIYNTAQLIQQFDDNGNPLYVRFYEDETGAAHKEILLENEYEALSEEEKEKARLYYDYSGLPMEGMLQESFKVYKAILSMDSEKIKEIWSDPTTRAMFKLQIHDLWFMAAMTFILTLIAGNLFDANDPLSKESVRRAAKKIGPLQSFAYDVITGSMADSQLPNILNSFTDRPPVVTALQRFGTSSWKVITGDANIGYWMTRNIGALRDFEGLVSDIKS